MQNGGDGDSSGNSSSAVSVTLRLGGLVWSRVWLQAALTASGSVQPPKHCLPPSRTSLGRGRWVRGDEPLGNPRPGRPSASACAILLLLGYWDGAGVIRGH